MPHASVSFTGSPEELDEATVVTDEIELLVATVLPPTDTDDVPGEPPAPVELVAGVPKTDTSEPHAASTSRAAPPMIRALRIRILLRRDPCAHEIIVNQNKLFGSQK